VLTHEQLKGLALASVRWNFSEDEPVNPPYMPQAHRLALEALGSPSEDDLVVAGLELLRSDDRNDRVAALRVLGWHLTEPRVAEAVLRATSDPVRRVREIATRMVPVHHPGAAERLLDISTDEHEYHKISRIAFMRVARRDLRPETAESIRELLDAESYRQKILLVFLTQGAPAGAEPLLEHVVQVGSKQEAVAATRVLCGYRVVRIDQGAVDLQSADLDWLFVPCTRTNAKYGRYYCLPPAA